MAYIQHFLICGCFCSDGNFESNDRYSPLSAGYFQLLVAVCQSKVFAEESFEKNNAQNHTTSFASESDTYNPSDFMVNRTWLDFLKVSGFTFGLSWLYFEIL